MAVIAAVSGGALVAWLQAGTAHSESVQRTVCEPVRAPEPVTLSQLDPASRERLRAEVLEEIREETRAQWLAEFRESQPITDSEEPDPEPIRPLVRENPAPARPLLPPTQKIERDAGGMKILRHTFSTAIDHRLPIDERE
ncbi:MAG: hypothetical protein II180_10610, partial [Proteobacteria bacterium]|nr:hypothetical protein [Pseudomonadota bacterium]